MRCADCGYENRTGLKFCTRCGSPLFLFCPKCGFGMMEGDIFCGDCGTKLPSQPVHSLLQSHITDHPATLPATPSPAAVQTSAPETARKHVTVLFADISGFTALSEKLDPEDVTTLMNGCLKRLADTVTKYEGYVDKFIGDCIMALWGAPVAHENDPELAIRTALEMKRATEEYNKTLPIKLEKPLMLHTGINSGMVVAGGVGSDHKMDYTVMGDTVNLASRLESLAGGGQIFISKYTYNLVRSVFEFIEHEPIKVKGKAEPVPVYEVVALRSSRAKAPVGSPVKTPLIGRSREMSSLNERIDRFLAGENQVVFLKSDAGIGKSRIRFEIESHIVNKHVQILQGRCHSFSRSTSYFLFSELLKSFLDIDSEDLPETMAEKLRSNIALLAETDTGPLSDEAKEAIVFLGSILGLDLGDEYDISTSHMDAQDIKLSIFRSIKWLFARLAARHPLLLILEDLHYADPSTIEVITYLFETIQDRQVMLLLSLRPDKGHASYNLPLIAQRTTQGREIEIIFDRLNPQDSDTMVKNLLKTSEVPEAILQMIRSRADGNPFYIEAIARDLLENSIIEVEEGQPVKLVKRVEEISIPETIQGMIVSQIDRLPVHLKNILQTASVIGPVFKYDLLQRVVNDPQLDDHLQRLAEMDMIFESKSFPEIEYSFKNILTQEAAYSCLLLKTQRELHRTVASAIEQAYHDRLDDYYEVLALHHRNSQSWPQAYEYAVKSGLKAKKIYANQNAIDHLNEALALSSQVPHPEPPVADLYVWLSEVYELTGELDRAIEARHRAIATLDDDLKKAESKRNIGRILEKQGNKEEALKVYEEVFELIKNHPDSIEMARLLMNESWVLNRMRQHDEAIEKCTRALRLFESYQATEDLAQAHNNLAVFYESKEELDLALEHNQKSLALFARLNNKLKLANVYLSLGYVYNKRKELDTALDHFERSILTMEKIGNRYGAGTALMAKGRCYLDMQRFDEAESVLSRALRLHQELNLPLKIVANALTLARVQLEKNNPQSARQYLDEARRIAVAEDNTADLAKITRLEATVLAQEGYDPSPKFVEAITAFQTIGREREAHEVMKEFEAYKAGNQVSMPLSGR